MAGTAANPVVLDPFRTIIEVGWGFRFIVLEISFRADRVYSDSVVCSPAENEVSISNPNWSLGLHSIDGTYLSGGAPIIDPTDEQKIINAWVHKGGAWQGLTWGDYGVTMPDLPANMQQVFGDFTRHDESPLSFQLPTAGTSITPADPDLKVPGFDDKVFDENTDISVDYNELLELTGSILCSYTFGNPDDLYRARAYTPGAFLPTLSLVFPSNMIAVTYRGATYHVIATKLVEPAQVFILLEKA